MNASSQWTYEWIFIFYDNVRCRSLSFLLLSAAQFRRRCAFLFFTSLWFRDDDNITSCLLNTCNNIQPKRQMSNTYCPSINKCKIVNTALFRQPHEAIAQRMRHHSEERKERSKKQKQKCALKLNTNKRNMCVVLVSTNYYPHMDFCASLKASPIYGLFLLFQFHIFDTVKKKENRNEKRYKMSTHRIAQMCT